MKYFCRLPWQIQFALLAPLLVLVAFSAAHGSQAYYEWRIRQAVEQALDSFDPETTEFTLFAADWLNGVPTRQKNSAQLTAEQRRLAGEWIDSFRYEKAFTQGYIGGSPYVWLEFDSPYGAVSANGIVSLETPYRIRNPLWLMYHDRFHTILRGIEENGISPTTYQYVAEFDTGPLKDKLWEAVMEKPRWFFPPLEEQ